MMRFTDPENGAAAARKREFSEREFRDALGMFATGVAVVTSLDRQQRKIGITVNSFTSVSLDPPLVSFNLAKSLSGISDWLAATEFAINLLMEDQDVISSRFARPNTDKWSGVEANSGLASCPVLRTKLAAFECERFDCHEAGDHYIMIGKVVQFTVELGAIPLLYFGGRYRKLGDLIARA
jgi:flavin reductase (DIM6/NTAB) family NADH-FMN oxidoreductase RutF